MSRTCWPGGQLAKIPGIGKSSFAKIEEFIKTGTITAHQELLRKILPELLELLNIPGVGPKGVKAVYEQLKVTSIAELKAVIEDGSLAGLPGFGDKKAAAIARGIAFLEKSTGRIRLDQALEASHMVLRFLRDVAGTLKSQTAGSLRRCAETIGDVDMLVATQKGKGSGRLKGGPLSSPTIISDGNWHRIGFVWDSSYRHLYVDGVEVAMDAAPLHNLEDAYGGLYFGVGSTLAPGTYFSGLFDDVRIYDVALTAEEIAALAQ
ncbi:MAG: LamG-like jellyroll fold domain-containing protein [Sedimentisphaerales bacterium]